MSNTLITKRLGVFLAIVIAFIIGMSIVPASVPAAHAQPIADEGSGETEEDCELTGGTWDEGEGSCYIPGGEDEDEEDDNHSSNSDDDSPSDQNAPPVGGGSTESSPNAIVGALGNIDSTKNQSASLTIYKHEGSSVLGSRGDGTELQTKPGKLLPGAEFTVRKVNGADFDVTKPKIWQKLSALRKAGKEPSVDLNGVVSVDGLAAGSLAAVTDSHKGGVVKTGEDGIARFAGLELGLYYVVETKTPKGVASAAKPFFVTIPFPHTGGESGFKWLYDVSVYPKNDKTSKVVSDQTPTNIVGGNTTVSNNKIRWDITLRIPVSGVDGATFKTFKVSDNLVSGLDAAGTTAKVKIEGETDYLADSAYSVSHVGQKISIEFTNTGLAQLDQHKGANLFIELTTPANSVTDHKVDNELPLRTWTYNEVPGKPGEPSVTPPSGEDTPPEGDTPVPPGGEKPYVSVATAYFGKISIKKVSVGQKLLLSGAEFCLATSEQNANDADQSNKTEKCIATQESGADGLVTFDNLYYGKDKAASRTYYVKEIKAPAGFKLSSHVYNFDVNQASVNKEAAEVTNTPYVRGDLPDLPLTGASGKLFMMLLGSAIVLFAAGTVLVTRRQV